MILMEDSFLLLVSHVWYGSVRRTVTQLLSQPVVVFNWFLQVKESFAACRHHRRKSLWASLFDR